jgi:hypothetical protein
VPSDNRTALDLAGSGGLAPGQPAHGPGMGSQGTLAACPPLPPVALLPGRGLSPDRGREVTEVYFAKGAFMDGAEPSSSPPSDTRASASAYRNGHGGKTSTVEIGPFTKIPNKFFGSGTAAMLGQSASLFFLALCEHANRNSDLTFKSSDKALASDTGLGTRTICDARKRLREKGLITCERASGQSFVYTLVVLSLMWVPVSERPRQKRKPRAMSVARA